MKWEKQFDKEFLIKSAFGQCINDQDGNANKRIKQFIKELLKEQREEFKKIVEGKIKHTRDFCSKENCHCSRFRINRSLDDILKAIKEE